jgi:hypothetical protein
MSEFQNHMNKFKKMLQKGDIQKAYYGLMEYIRSLKLHFEKNFPEYPVSDIYYGYMDMTYFSLFPEELKRRKLKIALVFTYDTYLFEVWLSGMNRKIQEKYWELIKKSGWEKYHLSPDPLGLDYVLDHVLVEDPDFSDLDALTRQIEEGTMAFIKDVEGFIFKLPD